MFRIFTTRLYQFLSLFSLCALFSDEPEVFLPKYSQMAILHAAHFRSVVKVGLGSWVTCWSDCQVVVGCIDGSGGGDTWGTPLFGSYLNLFGM